MANCSKNRGSRTSWGPTIIFSEKKTQNVRITVHLDLGEKPQKAPENTVFQKSEIFEINFENYFSENSILKL